MSQKNVMLSESSTALALSTVRVLCNGHFLNSDETKIDALAKRLVLTNEQVLVERLLPVCAKLATEDEMPGKLFSLIEETLMALTLFSDQLWDAKLEALVALVRDRVVSVIA